MADSKGLISDVPPYKCPACGWVMPVVAVVPSESGVGVRCTYACLRDHADDVPGVANRTGKIVDLTVEAPHG